MGRSITTETWMSYEGLREAGWSRMDAAKEVGISYDSARRFDRGLVQTNQAGRVVDVKKVVESLDADLPAPRSLAELSDVALEAVHDFDTFRSYYLGRQPKPWQKVAAERVVSLWETDQREWAVVNVPPGSGKSTTFTHDIPAWMIVRGRVLGHDLRTMLGSRTMRQATQYGRRVRATLMRKRPVDGAQGVLAKDFGQFQPSDASLWRAEEFIVWEDASQQPSDEKEPTVMCAGMDTGFLGGRFGLVVWDDLVDASTMRTSQAREKQRQWYDEEAETRLEPGGLFILMGQRLGPDDLYRYALDKHGVDELGEPTDQPKYHHVVFPAHDESRCADDHRRDGPAWPDGCLLDPHRLSWRDLMTVKNNNPRRYDVLMQQKDLDPAGVLVPREFIFGETWQGRQMPGCLDHDRHLRQLPDDVDLSRAVSVMSVDPSPTKFWSIQWWVYDDKTQFRWLIDLLRTAMDAPEFLDRHRDGTYSGVLDEWVLRSQQMGVPISEVVVERNAAQRFLLQYEHVSDWQALRGVNILPHDTHGANKSDPEFGIQTLRPHYMYGRVRLPYADHATQVVAHDLIDEVTVWPSGRTDDCVMAQWMFEWNLPSLSMNGVELPTRAVPSWLGRTG